MRRFILLGIVLVISLTLLFCTPNSQAVPMKISKILEDNVSVNNNRVTHLLKAYEDVENVVVVDYFYREVDVSGARVTKEEFLGERLNAVKIEVGDLKKGESIEISYTIEKGEGKALLGADIYYIHGERHLLFPKEYSISVESKGTFSGLIPFLIISVLIISLIYLMLKKKK